MANFLRDNDDLCYYIDKGLDWATLVKATEYDFRLPDGPENVEDAVELYTDMLNMVGEFVAEDIAPHSSAIDRCGVTLTDGEVAFSPKLDAIFERIRELDLHGLPLPRELGGLNAPLLLYFINAEMIARADVSVMTHHSFHAGMAAAMLFFSIKEGTTSVSPDTLEITSTRFEGPIQEIIAGEAWGCMDITESDAGSDMSALRTLATEDSEGNWSVTGQKIFITSGHGKYHFVIARSGAKAGSDDPSAGLAGLSLFLVPAYRDEPEGRVRLATVERVEEKLGHHGSATCTISFDDTPAQLIGQRGEGFKYMLMLMNNARLGVGFETLGQCEAAWRLARSYAAERPSMGKTIDRHEMIADYLDEMRTDIQGIRALAMYGAFHEEVAEKTRIAAAHTPDRLEQKRLESRAQQHKARARRVTPLLKYIGAEKAVEMSRRCVQIHGGNGYMTEYGAEKLLRDSIVMPIYEGTSQIQSLMAMKDVLGRIMDNPQGFVRRVAQTRWRSHTARDTLQRRVAKLQCVSLSAQQHLITKTAAHKLQGLPISAWPNTLRKSWDPKKDFAYAMLHAERLTQILVDEAVCELLLKQAKQHPERQEVLERYLERAEPRCRFLCDQITSTGQRLLADLRQDNSIEATLSKAG